MLALVGDLRFVDHAVVEHGDAVANPRVHDPDTAVNLAAVADRRPGLERHARVDDRVDADRHVAIDVGRGGIFNRHPGGHQRCVLGVSHDATHCRELDAAVDAPNLVGIRDGHGLDGEAAVAENGYEIRQVIFLLGVVGSETPHTRRTARLGQTRKYQS